MKKASLVFLALAALFLFEVNASAQTMTCASCGINSGNIARWRLVDANCSGTLSTFDLVQLTRLGLWSNPVSQVVYEGDLEGIFQNSIDITGDGLFNATDVQILTAFQTYFWLTGTSNVDVDGVMVPCLRLVILGSCG